MFSRNRVIMLLVAAFALLMINAPLALAQGPAKDPVNFSDDLKHPLGARQRALRQEAFQAQVLGQVSGNVYQSKSGKYVELAHVNQDLIWTVLGEFGNNADPTLGGTSGPAHNQIKKPNRRVDNTTIWKKNFSRGSYQNLLFSKKPGANSMHNFYLEQSSNLYTVDGSVEDWVKLSNNAAYYGSNYCGGIVCARTWLFLQDTLNGWYDQQVAKGMSPADINANLAKFDVWDRYDYNGNGNFNEPDGYIDHFQAIHAGEGEEAGGGAQGTDAIWSHRWYAFYNNIGSTGPAFNKFGGVRVGNSDFWVGDYTVEPENGGLGVFAHEFAHDLGMPDLYDTSGNTGGAENSTGFWTLMSGGSWGSNGKPKAGIGGRPIHMSGLEKMLLGWSNYAVVLHGSNTKLTLGPAEGASQNYQQVLVVLPNKQVQTNIGAPYAGSYFYYSGSGNDLDRSMEKAFALPVGNPSLAAKIRYDIETDWDYFYVTVNGTPVHTNLSTASNPNGQNQGEGITGSSGGNWVDLTADLTAYAGQNVTIGLRYWTDAAAVESGVSLDEIAISGQATDGAESDTGWTYDGWTRNTGSTAASYFNAYIGEYRQYRNYDMGLKTGPYNFGFLDKPALGNMVEHFPYQDGLLLWYYDTSYADNNVGDNCLSGNCGGLYLPIDAHPNLLMRPDGTVWRPRIQGYDSTFGLEQTDQVCLHANSAKQCYGPLPAVSKFQDSKSYWVAPNPSIGNYGWASVPVPNTGTSIRVMSMDQGAGTMRLEFEFAP